MKFICKLIPKISENKMKYKGRNIAVFLYPRNIPHIFLFSKIRIYMYIYAYIYTHTHIHIHKHMVNTYSNLANCLLIPALIKTKIFSISYT